MVPIYTLIGTVFHPHSALTFQEVFLLVSEAQIFVYLQYLISLFFCFLTSHPLKWNVFFPNVQNVPVHLAPIWNGDAYINENFVKLFIEEENCSADSHNSKDDSENLLKLCQTT